MTFAFLFTEKIEFDYSPPRRHNARSPLIYAATSIFLLELNNCAVCILFSCSCFVPRILTQREAPRSFLYKLGENWLLDLLQKSLGLSYKHLLLKL